MAKRYCPGLPNKMKSIMMKNKTNGRCIFCNGYGLSKQHVIPNWIRKFLSDDDKHHTVFNNRIQFTDHDILAKPGTIFIKPSITPKQGPVASAKLRIVCHSCNNGWMSKLEQQAKPMLTELMDASKKVITMDESLVLAQWVMMTSIMQAYTDPQGVKITPEQIAAFKSKQILPDIWTIYIGHHSDYDWRIRRKNEYRVFMASPRITKSNNYETHTAQTFSFGLGKLFILSISSTIDIGIPDLNKFYPNALSKVFENGVGLNSSIQRLPPGMAEEIGGFLISHGLK